MTNRKIEYWVIPPEADGEFVAHMEEVLEVYERPYNPAFPVLCMDEQPVQLLKETRSPIPATAKHGKRVDYEYERAVPPASSCSPSRWPVGVKLPFANEKRRLIGPPKWRDCWKAGTLGAQSNLGV